MVCGEGRRKVRLTRRFRDALYNFAGCLPGTENSRSKPGPFGLSQATRRQCISVAIFPAQVLEKEETVGEGMVRAPLSTIQRSPMFICVVG
jgi:hypothetical protein